MFPLETEREKLIGRVLRAILPLWFLALAGGVSNVYQALIALEKHPAFLQAALQTLFLYLLVTAVLLYLALTERLRAAWRAAAFLLILYIVALLGLAQAALFGDGRVILFAIVALSTLFFGRRGGLLALGVTALTMGGMAVLHVRGILPMPLEHTTRDASAWFSGTLVLLTLSFAVWVSLDSLQSWISNRWQELEAAHRQEAFLRQLMHIVSVINQQLVRATDKVSLLREACQALITLPGYSQVWIGLLDRKMSRFDPMVAAGEEAEAALQRWGNPLECPCVRHVLEKGASLDLKAARICESLTPAPDCLFQEGILLPLIRQQRRWGVLYLSYAGRDLLPEEQRVLQELADDLAFALEKLESEAQTQKLSQLALRFLTSHTLDELWERVLIGVREILQADRVAIYTYDRERDRLACLRHTGLSESYVEAVNRAFRMLPGSRVLQSSAPVVVQDVLQAPDLPLREKMIREGFRAYAVFPVFSAGGHVVAAFTAYRDAPLAFTEQDVHLGQTLAHFVAQALENLNLYERLQAQAAELGRLYAVAQDMAVSLLSPATVLEVLARHVLHALQGTSCAILMMDESRSSLKVLAEVVGERAGEEERRSRVGETLELREFPTLLRVIQSGLPVICRAGEEGLSAAEQASLAQLQVQSILLVPILVRSRLIGIIQLRERQPSRVFSQAEILLAQAMAGFGVVIESAQLFQELERREAFFRAVIEYAADGIAILDEQGYFRYLSPSVERLLGHPLEDIHHKSPFQYVHPDDLPAMQQAWEEGVRQSGVIRRVSYRFRNARGEWRHIEAVARNLLDDPNVRGVVLNFRDVTERVEAEQKLEQYARALADAYDRTLEGWAKALELRDELTEDHTRRVTEMAVRFARLLGLSEEQVMHIRRGAILHDIGKMALPDSILRKEGPLTPEERHLIHRHPQFAYEMLYPIEFLRPALEIPYAHHECWDGKGYPRRLKGEAIPLAARIFSIVDVWDALTTDRPYRKAWSPERALEYIRSQSGKMFDPTLVEFFAQHFQEIVEV